MRRLSSIVLLILFSLSLIAPALASTNISDKHLPACCRRNGAHHCTMLSEPTSSAPALSAIPQHCPAYPAFVIQARHGDWAFQATALVFAELVSHPAVRPQVHACARISRDRARHMRGPPVELL